LFVGSLIQHATLVRHIVIRALADSVFFHNGMIFGGAGGWKVGGGNEHKTCVLILSKTFS
jgi:hypothetical protein